MTDKIKELLAVLDMTEEKQLEWIAERFFNSDQFAAGSYSADLAFRLRDEANNLPSWGEAKQLVAGPRHSYPSAYNQFFADIAEAKHYILAALIANELQKGE